MCRLLMPALVGALALAPPPSLLAAGSPGSPCVPPGEVVVTDPAADTPYPEADLLEIAIAELHSGPHAGKLMVTLRTTTLADGPSGLWTVRWEDPAAETRTTLSMSACAGEATYSYECTTPEGTQSGAPDAAGYASSGTIEFVVSRDKVGDPMNGDVFARIAAVALPFDETLVCLPVPSGQDVTPEGSYTLGSCVVGVPGDRPVAALALGHAFPNPARHGVRWVLGVPAELAGGVPDAAVFDPAGRLVRALAVGPATLGRVALDWDLRDDAGRRLPPGTYWLRVALDGMRRVRPAVVTRH